MVFLTKLALFCEWKYKRFYYLDNYLQVHRLLQQELLQKMYFLNL